MEWGAQRMALAPGRALPHPSASPPAAGCRGGGRWGVGGAELLL